MFVVEHSRLSLSLSLTPLASVLGLRVAFLVNHPLFFFLVGFLLDCALSLLVFLLLVLCDWFVVNDDDDDFSLRLLMLEFFSLTSLGFMMFFA